MTGYVYTLLFAVVAAVTMYIIRSHTHRLSIASDSYTAIIHDLSYLFQYRLFKTGQTCCYRKVGTGEEPTKELVREFQKNCTIPTQSRWVYGSLSATGLVGRQ